MVVFICNNLWGDIMEKLSNSQLIENFLKEGSIDRIRAKILSDLVKDGHVDKAEAKIGKSILEMNFKEMLQFLDNVFTFESGSDYPMNYAMYYARYNIFDKVLTYYQEACDTVNVLAVRRPVDAYKIYLKGHPRITINVIEDYIRRAHISFDEDKADYVELLLRLIYEGFFGFEEIVKFKKSEFNTKNLVANVEGHKIRLSERTFKLLERISRLPMLDKKNRTVLVSWQNGYVKDVCFERSSDDLRNRSLNDFVKHFYNTYTRYVNRELEFPIKHNTIYFLGFYDFCVASVGEERMAEILLKETDKMSTKYIFDLMEQYDFKFESDRGSISTSVLKSDLRAFLPREVF